MKKNNLALQILARAIIFGISLGAVMGLVFQFIFFQISWQTIFWGAGFGGLGGLIVGLINGVAAILILPRFYSDISNIRKFRLKLNGGLLIVTVFVTFAIYTSIFYLFTGSSSGLLFAIPVVFLSAICSLIASHFLGSWYLQHIDSSKTPQGQIKTYP